MKDVTNMKPSPIVTEPDAIGSDARNGSILDLLLAMASAKRRSRILPFLASLPMASGSVTMGLGFIFVTSFIFTELGIRSRYLSLLFVIAAHLVIVLPFSV